MKNEMVRVYHIAISRPSVMFFHFLYTLEIVLTLYRYIIIDIMNNVIFFYMGMLLQVCRGTAVMLVSPTDGTDEIANPFIQGDGV